MRQLQAAATKLGARLFRRNVGMAWAGTAVKYNRRQSVMVEAGDVLVRNARPFRSALPGMSDLAGWVPVTVTPDMVGESLAVVAEVEVKENGRPTQEQTAWIEAVRKAGGRAGIARSEADLTNILRGDLPG